MLKMNASMRELCVSLSSSPLLLDPKLNALVSEGFENSENCILLKGCAQAHVSRKDFPDDVGYECFINSIHIDDYVENPDLEQSTLFAQAIFEEFQLLQAKEKLICIISVDDDEDIHGDQASIIVKFHIMRATQSWITGPLDEYLQPILVLDSTISNKELIGVIRVYATEGSS